jgi:hypothetical protein
VACLHDVRLHAPHDCVASPPRGRARLQREITTFIGCYLSSASQHSISFQTFHIRRNRPLHADMTVFRFLYRKNAANSESSLFHCYKHPASRKPHSGIPLILRIPIPNQFLGIPRLLCLVTTKPKQYGFFDAICSPRFPQSESNCFVLPGWVLVQLNYLGHIW